MEYRGKGSDHDYEHAHGERERERESSPGEVKDKSRRYWVSHRGFARCVVDALAFFSLGASLGSLRQNSEEKHLSRLTIPR